MGARMRKRKRSGQGKDTDGFTMLPVRVLDEFGGKLGFFGLAYYTWLLRHVNHDPTHPLCGYAWPSRRYTTALFRCHHTRLSRWEATMQQVGLLEVLTGRDLVQRGLVDEERLRAVLCDPMRSFVFRILDLPALAE